MYLYKYNGKEYQDELGLNLYDYGWRNFDPAIGRWINIDPLLNELKFHHDNSESEDDDQDDVYMKVINDLELGGGIYNTFNHNPYAYGYNNPVSFDDPDGRCPWCWGAVIGAAVDYGLQVAGNLAQGKDLGDSLTDIDGKSILVSAVAGGISGGISSIAKLKKASDVVKVAVDVGTDTGISVGSQYAKDGKVSLKNTVKDVAISQTIGRVAGKYGENKAKNSPKANQLKANINKEKNIARGKSNTTPKSKAEVKKAEKKLDGYVSKRSTASSAGASGGVTTLYDKITEDKNKPKN